MHVDGLEGGLCSGFEKSVIDADLCGKLIAFAEGIDLSENAQAMDAISQVGPGEHFPILSTYNGKFSISFLYVADC